ncbi:hypothetical protein FKM82_018872 [Ascaphus truei]
MAAPCVRLVALRGRPGGAALLRYLCGSVRHQAAAAVTAGNEEIVIPRRKTWDKLAVLQALSTTVNHDPTAAHYMFQDDPFLIPKTSPEFRIYSLSKESGRNAARYVATTYPKYFEKDIAEPHIPCLMPENVQPQIEGVSVEALKERIQLRKVRDSVDLYDQLIQGGTALSIETTNQLLDLLCFYGDREPARDDQTEQREQEEPETVDDAKKCSTNLYICSPRASGFNPRPSKYWPKQHTFGTRENTDAERIFTLMPDRDAHSFCTLIRGMVKYGAPSKAFNTYTDLLNNRMTADVYTFNALILAAPEMKEKYNEKWEQIAELLKHMVDQKVAPNLLTFNCVLKSLKRCGSFARTLALQTLCEMKSLNIEPSLATYFHLLGVFYKSAPSTRGQSEILAEVLDEIEGRTFTPQDPDDLYFFASAMRVCLDLKDIDLAYRLHQLHQTGDNWRLMGDIYLQSTYYGRFFNLLCMMENIDVILKWYRELIPSMYYPNTRGMMDLLQALDMDSRLDLIPQIWKDIKEIGHSNKVELVEEVLNLMARDKQPAELQAAFANTALDIKSVYENRDRLRVPLEWSAGALGNVSILLSRTGRTEESWKMLQLFKTSNRVPTTEVIDEFLNSAKDSGSNTLAVSLVQLAGGFSLQSTAMIAQRVMDEFSITEEQK